MWAAVGKDPWPAFRTFGISLAVTAAALAAGYAHGGPNALFLLVVLAVLEVSLSFDNAIINAAMLQRMSPFWQQMFLTVGILIAVFGMRLVFPLVIVWATAGLDPVRAMELALDPPPHGALEFPDGSPSYEKLIISAHPQIAAFGGTFLLMLFLDFVFHERDIKWLKWIEVPFARIGRLGQVSVVVAGVVLVLVGTQLTHSGDERATVLTAGLLGLVTYLVVNGLSRAFRPSDVDAAAAVPGIVGRRRSARPVWPCSSISRCSTPPSRSTGSPAPSRSPRTRLSSRWAWDWWARSSSGPSPSTWSGRKRWIVTSTWNTARTGRSARWP